MVSIDYKDIYSKTLLNDIKSRIIQNRMKLEGNKEKKTDAKMIEVIKDLCIGDKIKISNSEKCILILQTSSEEETERIFCTLMLYYAALYNDNIELLNKLLNRGYFFGNKRYELDLFALDKRISSKFNEELYFDLLEKQSPLFENFYYSLGDNINVTDEESITDFCSILNKDPNVACFKSGIRKELLTKRSIAYFGQDTILNATDEQKKNIISDDISLRHITSDELERIINLMKNKTFTKLGYKWHETLQAFSNEEILKINAQEENLFRKYFDVNTVKIDYDGIRKEINPQSQKAKKTSIKKKILTLFNNRKNN